MNRRDFIVRSSLVVSAGLLPRGLGGAEGPVGPAMPSKPVPPPVVTEFRALRRGVGIFTGRGGTIGWLSNKDALAVVDTQFPDTAAACLAGLPERGGRTIDVVINTHHHGDHTSGNPVFKSAAKTIVAHANVPALQLAAAERAEKAGSAGAVAKQVFADTTFTETWRQELGDEVVTARYFGAGHTKGDVIVHFERANVIHLGDLMFNRLYPVIDRPGGASVRHWITVLEEAIKTFPADGRYVFGHGSQEAGVTGGLADVGLFRDYLNALLEHVQKEIAAGKTRDQIVSLDNFPGFPALHTPLPNRLGGNLGVVYDELTAKS